MKVSKEIAEKAAEYEALKEKSDKLFEELQKWFSFNASYSAAFSAISLDTFISFPSFSSPEKC